MIDREHWQNPAQPVSGPPPRGVAGTWVIHYPGTAGQAAPVGGAVVPYLRAIQNHYVNARGYSIGYSYGVAQDGSQWEIRGEDFNPASNPGRKVEGNFNNVSRSILVMVANQDEATPLAVASVNEIIATRPGWDVIVHSDVDYTSCAGEGLTGQVRSGVIGHQIQEDEDEMKTQYVWRHRDKPGAYWVCDGSVVHLDEVMRDDLRAKGVKEVVSSNDSVAASFKRVAQGL